MVAVLGYVIVLTLAAVAVLNMHRPAWNLEGWLPLPTLMVDVSRTRMERIDHALQLHRLLEGSYPKELGELAAQGLLADHEFLDPWSQPYGYRQGDEGRGYLLIGKDAQGQALPELMIRRTEGGS